MSIAPVLWAQVALFALGWLGPWRDPPERKTKGRLPVQVRMLLSLSLLLAALWVWRGGFPRAAAYGEWVFWGMAFSFIGDLIMARIIPLPNRLIGGMLAFGAAHALYITAYRRTIETISSPEPYPRWDVGLVIGLVVYGLVALGGWWFLIRDPRRGTVTNAGALVYGLWISVMAAHALALACALGVFWTTALGGLLFVASDFILGMTNTREISLKNANDWIWLTYVAGQMAIVYGGLV